MLKRVIFNILMLASVASVSNYLNAQSCPFVEKFLINACGPGSEEGFNEYVLINTGPSGLDINNLQLCFPTPGIGCYCNSGCGTQTFVSNTTYINALNAAAGCSPPLFVDAVSNNPLPPNALLLVFTGNPPTITYNFSQHCGQGPIYVLFANNTTDGTGRFGNSKKCSGSSRYATLSASFGPGCSDNITYDRCNLVNTNGESIVVNDDGSLTYGVTDGCTVLPEKNLIILNYDYDGDVISLKWTIPEETPIVQQWISIYRNINETSWHDSIEIEIADRTYIVPNDWLPAAVRIEAITQDSVILQSNPLFLPAVSKNDIIISTFPEPHLIHCNPRIINIQILTMDGIVIFSGAYTNIDEANINLKSTFRKLHNGVYILRINDDFHTLITKH